MSQTTRSRFTIAGLAGQHETLLVLLLTLLALALRLYRLGDWSLWGDEAITVRNAQNVTQWSLLSRNVSLLLGHQAFQAFGISEWSARLAPALIGVLSIPLVYLPVRRLFGPAVALLAGLLLSISTWHLYWSQNARFYTALLLFYTLGLFCFYLAIEEDRPWFILCSLLLFGLATRERTVAFLFVPVILSYLILLILLPLEKPPGLRARNLVIFFLPSLAAGLYFVLPYLRQPESWLVNFGRVNNNPLWILAGVAYYVGLPAMCLGAAGGYWLVSRRNRGGLLLALNAVLPLAVIMTISLVHYAANRYVFISLPSWLALAAWAAVEVVRRLPREAAVLALGAVAILIAQPLADDFLYYRYQNGNRDDWRAAFQFVREHQHPGDVVVVPSLDVAKFYLPDRAQPMGGVDLAQIQQGEHRVWFVEDMNVAEIYPGLLAWLHQNTRQVADFDVRAYARTFKMRVYLFEPGGD